MNEERQALMLHLVREVRDDLRAKYRTLANLCDIGADDIARKLVDNDIHGGKVVTGLYQSTKGKMTHSWIEIDGFILDPTIGQFGGKKLIQPRNTAILYTTLKIYRTF